jgi:TonB-linked SusC/RagA family outer membrane protein
MKITQSGGGKLLLPLIPRQLLLCMKLTVVLLTMALMQVSASGVSQTITYSGKDAPLREVFAAIKKQTAYVFFYNDADMAKAKPVTVAFRNVTLEVALKESLKGQPLEYVVRGNTVFIRAKGSGKIEDGEMGDVVREDVLLFIDIKGRVVDEEGKPVAGATVTVKGTSKATSTNDNGEFVLTGVSGDAVLVVSGVSIETYEVKVGGRTSIEISATTRVIEGKTVVINTGYQKISKERMVGSFSQLDSAAFHRRAGMRIIDRLDGAVTGVLFDKKGNNPIQIRGISTLRLTYSPSMAPLVILDNFPYTGDINAINPNDVENVTILKDAAAASIWGSRAGNGVIVITTKKGRYNQPFQISASSNVSLQEKPDLYYYPQMGIADFIEIERLLFNGGQYDAALSDTRRRPVVSPVVEVLAQLRSGNISQEEADAQIASFKTQDIRSDLDRHVYQKALSQQHYINFSGGRDNVTYAFSGGYNYARPNIQGSKGDEQYTINSNTTFRLIDNLEINAGVNFTQGVIKSVNSNFLSGLKVPYLQLADAQGNSLALPNTFRMSFLETTGGGQLQDWMYRPLDEIRLVDNTTTSRFARLNLSGRYQVATWLSAELGYQYVNETSNARNYYNQQTYLARNLINLFTNLNETDPSLRNPIPIGGILDLSNSEANSHNLRGQLNFNWNWNGRHILNGIIAGEQSQTEGGVNSNNRLYGYNDFTGSYATLINYATFYPIYNRLTSTRAAIPFGGSLIEGSSSRFVSLLSNVSYTYKGRYTAYASARRDGSNVFGVKTNNKWKPLWSAGIGWDISKENFYAVTWLPSLRLTASYGYSGNVNNNISGVPTIQYSSVVADFSGFTYASAGLAPNPNLRWEQVRMFNTGLDFSVLKNRLSGKIEYFNKRSTDLISAVPFPPSTGVSSFYVNASSLKGHGFDITLNSINTTGALRWETRFSFSHAKMIVTKLYQENRTRAEEFVGYRSNSAVGKIAYGISSYRWAGLDPATGDPLGYLNGQISKDYNAIFNDLVDNQAFHGSAIPLYNGFLNNSLSWKNFTLSANITYRLDFYFRRPSLAIDYTSLIGSGSGHADFALRWQKAGDELFTSIPSILYPTPPEAVGRELFYSNAEVNIARGDNIRLQDVRLSYDWFNRNSKRLLVKSLQFYVYANSLNAILWRKDRSKLDPDFVGGNTFTPPTPKIWTGGVNITF